MRVTRESESGSTDEKQSADRAPTLKAIVRPEMRPEKNKGKEDAAGEKDWDPYVVWKKLIRRSPDPA